MIAGKPSQPNAERRAILVINTYEQALTALKQQSLAQALYDEGAQVMADALITLQGDAHQQRRVIEFSVFKRGFFRHYEQHVFPNTLAPLLAPLVDSGEADLVEFGYRVTMNLTADFAGIDRADDDAEETQALLNLVKKFSEGATLVHSTRDRETVRGEVDAAMQRFDTQFFQPSYQRRLQLLHAVEQGNLASEALPNDVLTTLVKNRERLPLEQEVLRREIAFYLQAGAHSTANASIRALDELFAWRERNPEQWQQRKDDPLFIQRCVHESLRLHPSSPVAWRRATCPLALGGQRLQTDESVEIDLHTANRDPLAFGDDADGFNPDRTLAQNVWPWGLSFGYGVHACLGRDLDGGVQAKPGTDPQSHQYGIVTLLLRNLLSLGVDRHPTKAPVADQGTKRNTWSSYPVVLNSAP